MILLIMIYWINLKILMQKYQKILCLLLHMKNYRYITISQAIRNSHMINHFIDGSLKQWNYHWSHRIRIIGRSSNQIKKMYLIPKYRVMNISKKQRNMLIRILRITGDQPIISYIQSIIKVLNVGQMNSYRKDLNYLVLIKMHSVPKLNSDIMQSFLHY